MISRRELLIRAVMDCCQAAVVPASVLRQPTTAIARDQTPALILAIVSDAPVKRSNDRMERELVVRLTGYTRDPTDGYAVADELLCKTHLALLADATLGGSLPELLRPHVHMLLHVAGPTLPSIPRPNFFCHAMTARSVAGPYSPSTCLPLNPSFAWIRRIAPRSAARTPE